MCMNHFLKITSRDGSELIVATAHISSIASEADSDGPRHVVLRLSNSPVFFTLTGVPLSEFATALGGGHSEHVIPVYDLL